MKEIYEDKDGQRREEVAKLSGPNEFAEFYERLKGIKEFHRRHPGESISIPMSVEFEELKKAREGNDDTVMAEFTDEEGKLNFFLEKYFNLTEIFHIFGVFISRNFLRKLYFKTLTKFVKWVMKRVILFLNIFEI